jgi:Zn/Cd-binding protein ZinT
MGKFILTEEDRKSIRGLYGLNEQSSEIVPIKGEQPYPNGTDWDSVHGILGSKKIDDDLEKRVGDKLKSGSYRVTNVKVSSYVSGNKVITDGTVTLVSDTNNPDIAFTTRGSILDNYEQRHDNQVNGLVDRLSAYYQGTARQFGPFIVDVKGTTEKYKQSFFAISKPNVQSNTQPNTPETESIDGNSLDEFRNNLKSKTADISIDENSVNFSYSNNSFNVKYSTGETKIGGMTLVFDPSETQLDFRIETKIKELYPNLIRKEEWKGKSKGLYYEFLILKK